MPRMNFDLEDGLPRVSFDLTPDDAERFCAFMAECTQALKRDTPKKPHEEHRTREYVEHGNTAIYRCSSCKGDLLVGFHFCPDCGQRLDWSEE